MRKIFDNILNKFKDSMFSKTYVLILLPVLGILVYMFFSIYSYNKNYVQLLKSSYLTKLESICTQNETSLQNITTIIEMLYDNESFMSIVASTDDYDAKTTDNISKLLNQATDNNTLIDSISVFNRAKNIVHTNSGTVHGTKYFTTEYYYSEYPKGFWENYSSPMYDRRILTPTIVRTSEAQKTIIPIVFSNFKKIPTNNIMIVNADLSKIISDANNSKFTENSSFLVINKNRNIFNENNYSSLELGDNFFDEIFSNTLSSFDCTVDGKLALIMSYSPDSSILGYSYVAVVPYSDITSSTLRFTYIILFIGLLVLITVLAVAYFSTKSIYTPIENLASMFENSAASKKNRKETNTLKKLHTSIQETLESYNSLSNEVSKVLPLVQERYLINFLNSNEHYAPHGEHLDMPIDFKYEYFCSIVIKLKPTDQFYNLYNTTEYSAIKTGIHNIIQSEFSKKYDVYIIPSETDTLYVLLNLPDDMQTDSILAILENFQNIMDYDKDYMTLKIATGGIYPKLDGLKQSHHEAINSVSTVIGLTHVRVNNENTEKKQTYSFDMNDENTLVNYLILGHVDGAKALIESVLTNNIYDNISDTAVMQLYVQILNIIFKVMRMKNISYDSNNSGDFHIITDIIKQPVSEIHETVMKYINVIDRHMGNSNTKVDIQSIISYVNENFRDEINLESIADNFNTTPKYLSKLIKDKLGINFVDYLAGLRINAAKTLLTQTDKNISDIFVEVGFNNRNTFIRTFKKSTGLTPSEFRKKEL